MLEKGDKMSVKSTTAVNSRVFDNNFDKIIRTSFELDTERLSSKLRENNAMIAGGLALHCFTVQTKEALLNYKGDCDIWVNIFESSNLEEYFEKFTDLDKFRDKEKVFDDLLTSAGYTLVKNTSQELLNIGKSLSYYKDYNASISRLEKLMKDSVTLPKEDLKGLQDTVNRLKELRKMSNMDVDKRNFINDERLSLLFPPKTKEEKEEARIMSDILSNIGKEVVETSNEYVVFTPPRMGQVSNMREVINGTIEQHSDYDEEDQQYEEGIVRRRCRFDTDSEEETEVGFSDSEEEKKIIKENKLKVKRRIIDKLNGLIASTQKELMSFKAQLSIIKYSNKKQDKKKKEMLKKLINSTQEKVDRYSDLQTDFCMRSQGIDLKSASEIGFDKVFTINRYIKQVDGVEKEVQVIFTFVSNEMMLQLFDLSFCAVGYNGGTLRILEPELTRRMVGYRLNYRSLEREKSRSLKYMDRGFTIYKTSDMNEDDIVTREELA